LSESTLRESPPCLSQPAKQKVKNPSCTADHLGLHMAYFYLIFKSTQHIF
jgi:hypothetical protein